jgi:dolichol kinase
MYLLGGIFLLIVAIATYIVLFRIGRHFERAAFNRRNAAGLEQFGDYDEAERTRLKEAGGRVLMTGLLFLVFIPSLLGGVGLIIAFFVND